MSVVEGREQREDIESKEIEEVESGEEANRKASVNLDCRSYNVGLQGFK